MNAAGNLARRCVRTAASLDWAIRASEFDGFVEDGGSLRILQRYGVTRFAGIASGPVPGESSTGWMNVVITREQRL